MALMPCTPPLPAVRKARLGREGRDGLSAGSSGESSLGELHRVGRKHAKVAIGPLAMPPALIDDLRASDEVLGLEGDLGTLDCLVVV